MESLQKKDLNFLKFIKQLMFIIEKLVKNYLMTCLPKNKKKQKDQLYLQLSICGTFCQVLLKSIIYRDRLLLNQTGILIYKIIDGSF